MDHLIAQVDPAAVRRGQPAQLEQRAGSGAGVEADQHESCKVTGLMTAAGDADALGDLVSGQEIVFARRRLRWQREAGTDCGGLCSR